MSSLELWLPHPPSANHLWRGGRGRVFPSAPYVAWISEATGYVYDQLGKLPKTPLCEPYKLFVTAKRPMNKKGEPLKRDLDNIIKPISDLLKRLNFVEDDSHCVAIHARWVTTGDGVAVRVERAGIE